MRNSRSPRRRLVWEIERKPAEDDARPILFYLQNANCSLRGPLARSLGADKSLPDYLGNFQPGSQDASVLSPSRLEPLRLVPSRRRRHEAQVLTFHTKAWSSFAPPTCRMPLGQYQGILIPEEGSPPVLTSPNPLSTLLQRFACARLSRPCLPKSCLGVSVTLPSRPGEFHPEPLTDPDLTLPRHPARATERRLPPPVENGSSSCCQLAHSQRR